MLLEVIATNLADAIAAERSGAHRIELVTGMLEGGLTPSIGLIEEVIRSVTIPVNVMVRPHSLSFVYGAEDLRTMRADIRAIRGTGAAGIVVGALTEDRKIDTALLRVLIAEAEHLDVTFHRAFDETEDQFEALGELAAFPQISRVLTSGGQPSALRAMGRIRSLVEATEGTRLRILAGAGLTVEALPDFLRQTGAPEVHFGSAVREDGHGLRPIVPERIASIRSIFEELEREG
ncbi:copper homeostasis protein CutC [Cohnella thailandensis]|uniref:PF03932 family protein CutC n=1 Tax=Cohnella thailandensis TaxID=557557 RepID=A0A841SPN0_9BACL|nr:copper homeostasis protein CutC [Cohnella thailandensis]MBB6633914.1 copper homeostasis protein CutC [Cohnella thailandensis]MBP1972597.1 copper homeostasis protein [Cohnella thailandensis]